MSTEVRTPKLGPHDEGRAVSADEYATADFERPWRYERIEGRLVVSPPGQLHNDKSRPWRMYLSEYWLNHRDLVEDVLSECWLRIDDETDRIGDIGVYLLKDTPQPPI